jgi:acyl-CoA thioesterase-1
VKILTQQWRREYWLRALIAWALLGWASSFWAVGPAAAVDDRPVVLFLGTSLTAGYGLPSAEAFPARIQEKIDRESLRFRVVNAGVSGDTSAGGLRRIDWLLQSSVSVLVIELGANDMLRGLATRDLQENLIQIIERTRSSSPDAKLLIAGMRAAPNLGRDYASRFESVYRKIALKFDAPLIPFILEKVALKPKLNQVDGIHPTAEGHRLVAETVWTKLAPMLRKPLATAARNSD